jgi:hypothetical protein
VNDIEQDCPSVQTIVHSKWLMINGSMEEIQEGEGQHPCYRVHRHDTPFTEGTNVWVEFDWDKKCNLFWNHCLLHLFSYNNGIGLDYHFKDTNDELITSYVKPYLLP